MGHSSEIPIGVQIAGTDVWVMLGVAALLAIYLLRGATIGGSVCLMF